jgi:hypothetical protein
MPHRYAPMLRSKAGEATALTNLTTAAKSRMMPVIHLVNAPPPTFSQTVAAAWRGMPMALDGTFETNISGSAQNFSQMAAQLGSAGVSLIPSVEYNATPPYLTAVQRLRGLHAPGVLVKVRLNQLRNVSAWVANQAWNLNEIDLVVTLGEIANFDPDTLIPAVINTIQGNIQSRSPWRTITLSSSAAPQDHGGLVTGRNDVPRLEWQVWSGVVRAALPYRIDYSDYSTITPDLTDPPGYVMSRATVSVRYTIDDYWIILKGRPTTGRTGQPMTGQYRAHARTLVGDRNFGGLTGCWADGRIQQIASGAQTPGNRSQWAAYAANRHLSFIADRLP